MRLFWKLVLTLTGSATGYLVSPLALTVGTLIVLVLWGAAYSVSRFSDHDVSRVALAMAGWDVLLPYFAGALAGTLFAGLS